ncbi:unnamed protein product [Brassicogethes aeneus]|uniref:Uncharacterized protein n=1 Tax=Brassicogethes aeneus TaxID=1431903 RepID=A0A9P0FH15_BRAAE|nr:unnamed protein product [Brassicogethes aeneus]
MPADENKKSEGNMKCCAKKTCAVYVCVNCYGIYHKSCHNRNPSSKIIEGNKIECCMADNKMVAASNREKIMEIEILYLKQLLEESKDKNNILKVSNQLLMEKVVNLENINAKAQDFNKKLYSKKAAKPIQSRDCSRQKCHYTVFPMVQIRVFPKPQVRVGQMQKLQKKKRQLLTVQQKQIKEMKISMKSKRMLAIRK